MAGANSRGNLGLRPIYFIIYNIIMEIHIFVFFLSQPGVEAPVVMGLDSYLPETTRMIGETK